MIQVTALKKVIADALSDNELKLEETNKIVEESVKDEGSTRGLTRTRLETIRDAFEQLSDEVVLEGNTSDGDAQQRAYSMMQELYWAMPRNLRYPGNSGHPSAGQTFEEKTNIKGPQNNVQTHPTLSVNGSAQRDYTLTFWLAQTLVKVEVTQGMTAEATAKAIADAVNDLDTEEMWRAIDAEAIHFDDQPDNAYVTAKATGATVTFVPDIEY